MSAAWRGRPEAAIAAMTLCTRRISDLRASVRVLEPPSPYALGTSNAPILVTIGNGLPFTVQVRLEISSTSGLRVAPIEMQQVPPLGRRQASVSAEVTRSGQFTVLAAVRSPDGELLGPPSRLRVQSTAYGTITVWLTGSAGVLLVVLAIRRVLRRVRGEPSRRTSTSGPPQPGRPDLPSPHPVDPVPAAPAGSDVTEPVDLRKPEAVPGDPEPIPAPDAGREPTVPPTPAVVPALLAPSAPSMPPDRAFAPGPSIPPGRPVTSNRGNRPDPVSPAGPAGPPVPNSRHGPGRPAEPGRRRNRCPFDAGEPSDRGPAASASTRRGTTPGHRSGTDGPADEHRAPRHRTPEGRPVPRSTAEDRSDPDHRADVDPRADRSHAVSRDSDDDGRAAGAGGPSGLPARSRVPARPGNRPPDRTRRPPRSRPTVSSRPPRCRSRAHPARRPPRRRGARRRPPGDRRGPDADPPSRRSDGRAA